MTQFKKGDVVVRRDGQVGVVDGDFSPTTGRVPVCFDTEKPARMIEPDKITLYQPERN